MKKTETIQIRLTAAEKDAIQAAAGREPVSQWVRQRLLSKTSPPAPADSPSPATETPKPKSSTGSSRAKPNFRPI